MTRKKQKALPQILQGTPQRQKFNSTASIVIFLVVVSCGIIIFLSPPAPRNNRQQTRDTDESGESTEQPRSAAGQSSNQSGFATIMPTATDEPLATATQGQSPQQQAELSLGRVTIAHMNSVMVNADANTITIDFNILGNDNIPAADRQMGEMLCAIRAAGPSGYSLSFIGRLSNGEIGVTATISPTAIETVNCVRTNDIDWAGIADEYTSGAVSQSANSAPTTANTSRRPANCDDAIAMGLTEEQAGQWPHLDRDNDGKACYGD
jgi:hypothetical protein